MERYEALLRLAKKYNMVDILITRRDGNVVIEMRGDDYIVRRVKTHKEDNSVVDYIKCYFDELNDTPASTEVYCYVDGDWIKYRIAIIDNSQLTNICIRPQKEAK